MGHFRTWQAIRGEVERRVKSGAWPPGHDIPNEADLALEFGCSRGTVNRALRSLAEDGVLERRRKAGTRVAEAPVQRLSFQVPLLRMEIEALGMSFDHKVLDFWVGAPPPDLADLGFSGDRSVRVLTLYRADGAPFALEDRWINTLAVTGLDNVDFKAISPNEYLLKHVPLTRGDLSFGAASATVAEALALGCKRDAALFDLQRTTWREDRPVTRVRMVYAPGYRMTGG